MKIEVFNTAGEKVKDIINTRISNDVTGASLLVGGSPANTFCPDDKDLDIRLPGVNWPQNLTGANSDFAWDGTSDVGQKAAPGIYYIKIEVVDQYGHANTLVMQVQILRSMKDVVISIYNSAGELIRSLEGSAMPPSGVTVDMDPVVTAGGNVAQKIRIFYGGGNYVTWDGMNNNGGAITSGIYEVKAEIVTPAGVSTMASKTITVLVSKSDKMISNIKIYPNPYVSAPDIASAPAVISWDHAYSGSVLIKIYNTSGELVKMFNRPLSDGKASWDLKMEDGKFIASGLFIVIIEAVSDAGAVQKEILKFAVIIKGETGL